MERSTDNRKVEGSTPFRPTNYMGSYTSLRYYTVTNGVYRNEEMVIWQMPTKLITTIKQIKTAVSNPVNSALINDFYQYMKANGASERHQNNNLNTIYTYMIYLTILQLRIQTNYLSKK